MTALAGRSQTRGATRLAVVGLAAIGLFAGCSSIGKPTASPELARSIDRLMEIQASVTEESVKATPASAIPDLVRHVGQRYDQLAHEVGQTDISTRSPEEQGAWQALGQLAAQRAAHLKDLADQMDSATPSKDEMEVTNLLQAPFEQTAVDALNAALANLDQP